MNGGKYFKVRDHKWEERGYCNLKEPQCQVYIFLSFPPSFSGLSSFLRLPFLHLLSCCSDFLLTDGQKNLISLIDSKNTPVEREKLQRKRGDSGWVGPLRGCSLGMNMMLNVNCTEFKNKEREQEENNLEISCLNARK